MFPRQASGVGTFTHGFKSQTGKQQELPFSLLWETAGLAERRGTLWDRRRRHPEDPAGTPTLEAATSWAVLAAISWEQTISSSYFPVCRTTLSADSLQWGSKGDCVTDTTEQVQIIHLLLIPSEISSWIQQLCNYRIMKLLQLEKISKIFESSCC